MAKTVGFIGSSPRPIAPGPLATLRPDEREGRDSSTQKTTARISYPRDRLRSRLKTNRTDRSWKGYTPDCENRPFLGSGPRRRSGTDPGRLIARSSSNSLRDLASGGELAAPGRGDGL